MKTSLFAMSFGCLLASHAYAGPCEDNFSRTGNPLVGVEYKTSIALVDLGIADAIKQARNVAARANMSIIIDEAAEGSLMVEEPATATNKAIPLVFSATTEGNITRLGMSVKVNRGAISRADDMKKYMCDFLAPIRGGREGRQFAANTTSAVSASGATRKDAYIFAQELSLEAKDSSAVIPLRYRGRTFTLTGRVKYVIKDGDFYRVAYDIPETKDSRFALSSMPMRNIGISCLMAAGQNARAIALRAGDRLELTGVYYNFDDVRSHFWLNGCRFAN
jgi:hypothetical protein